MIFFDDTIGAVLFYLALVLFCLDRIYTLWNVLHWHFIQKTRIGLAQGEGDPESS